MHSVCRCRVWYYNFDRGVVLPEGKTAQLSTKLTIHIYIQFGGQHLLIIQHHLWITLNVLFILNPNAGIPLNLQSIFYIHLSSTRSAYSCDRIVYSYDLSGFVNLNLCVVRRTGTLHANWLAWTHIHCSLTLTNRICFPLDITRLVSNAPPSKGWLQTLKYIVDKNKVFRKTDWQTVSMSFLKDTAHSGNMNPLIHANQNWFARKYST